MTGQDKSLAITGSRVTLKERTSFFPHLLYKASSSQPQTLSFVIANQNDAQIGSKDLLARTGPGPSIRRQNENQSNSKSSILGMSALIGAGIGACLGVNKLIQHRSYQKQLKEAASVMKEQGASDAFWEMTQVYLNGQKKIISENLRPEHFLSQNTVESFNNNAKFYMKIVTRMQDIFGEYRCGLQSVLESPDDLSRFANVRRAYPNNTVVQNIAEALDRIQVIYRSLEPDRNIFVFANQQNGTPSFLEKMDEYSNSALKAIDTALPEIEQVMKIL